MVNTGTTAHMKPNKLTFECQVCGKSVTLPRSSAIGRKTCSRSCMAEQKRQLMRGNTLRKGLPPDNAFAKNHKPWNAGVKGIRLSPTTEFKPGQIPVNLMPIGTESVRVDKNGQLRMWVKVGSRKWKLRAVVVWEQQFGPVPSGLVIHHHDRNTLNDSIDNLMCMTRKAHINEHRHELKSKIC